ncbi:F-box-like/WD repeat-containing protein TBL1XR1 [Histomonas meleagridis]|uniref:F-box-like/WD repeat-containing protein TBL1XR1 n=1 Tax=Histomonas meleagridis TaxID=135588 RepID=UPI0035593F96|nr:F-box-like/WD repeat-containing protein TBL1XR1 [Histomonas meleagridis]KAH0806940.1 F-box-like/WD repeat-containing protein TBL1XR1 [Histomonas meleagridis]
MSISSDEINFLIQRYFYECGFEHSLYTFNAESTTDLSNMNGSQIPPGALITLLQKGLLYIQLEKEIQSQHKGGAAYNAQLTLLDAALREGSVLPRKPEAPSHDSHDSVSIHLDHSNSILLAEHTKDALCCSWSFDSKFLATGSSDNTAIIWDVSNPDSITSCILQHNSSSPSQVSSLDWSPKALFLATGCSDGTLHIWNSSGEELNSVKSNTDQELQSIHVVKFDPSGERILYGNDTSIGIVSTESGDILSTITCKHNAILDASWKNESVYAVGCDDGFVLIFDPEVNNGKILEMAGHNETVNGVSWSLNGEFLASCSDDKTIRLWKDGNSIVLKGHTNPVYAVRWNEKGILASASFDNTLRIWDPQNGTCLHTLQSHTMQIYAICFSPDGELIASGSADQSIKVWRVSDGKLLCTCMGTQGIFDVQMDKLGNYISVCFVGGNVALIPTANLHLGANE